MSAVQVAGYSIIGRDGRVWLVDHHPGADPNLTPVEARTLAVALCSAADRADGAIPLARKERT
jgi:hypothetical protein